MHNLLQTNDIPKKKLYATIPISDKPNNATNLIMQQATYISGYFAYWVCRLLCLSLIRLFVFLGLTRILRFVALLGLSLIRFEALLGLRIMGVVAN